MSKITNRETTPQDGGPVEHRLARLLDGLFLARVVPHLPPETLHQLIRYRGLDACGELVTSATPAQLTLVLDLDLWRHARPGRDEQFDADRFGEWLEVLVESGTRWPHGRWPASTRTSSSPDFPATCVCSTRHLRTNRAE